MPTTDYLKNLTSSTPLDQLTQHYNDVLTSPEFTQLSPQEQIKVRQNLAKNLHYNPEFESLGNDVSSPSFAQKAGLVNWTLGTRPEQHQVGEVATIPTPSASLLNALKSGVNQWLPALGYQALYQQAPLQAEETAPGLPTFLASTVGMADPTMIPAAKPLAALSKAALGRALGAALPPAAGEAARLIPRQGWRDALPLFGRSASEKVGTTAVRPLGEQIYRYADPALQLGAMTGTVAALADPLQREIAGEEQTIPEALGHAATAGLEGYVPGFLGGGVGGLAGRLAARGPGVEAIPGVGQTLKGFTERHPLATDIAQTVPDLAGTVAGFTAGKALTGQPVSPEDAAQEFASFGLLKAMPHVRYPFRRPPVPKKILEESPAFLWNRIDKKTGAPVSTEYTITGYDPGTKKLDIIKGDGSQTTPEKMDIAVFNHWYRKGSIKFTEAIPESSSEIPPIDAAAPPPESKANLTPEQPAIQERAEAEANAVLDTELLNAKRARLTQLTQNRTDFLHSLIQTGKGKSSTGGDVFTLDSTRIPETDRLGFGHFAFGEFVDRPLQRAADKLKTAKTLEQVNNEQSTRGLVNKGVRESIPGSGGKKGGNQELLDHLSDQWAGLPEEKKQWFRKLGEQADVEGKPLLPQYRKINLPGEQDKAAESIRLVDQTPPAEKPVVPPEISQQPEPAPFVSPEQRLNSLIKQYHQGLVAFRKNPNRETYSALAEVNRSLGRIKRDEAGLGPKEQKSREIFERSMETSFRRLPKEAQREILTTTSGEQGKDPLHPALAKLQYMTAEDRIKTYLQQTGKKKEELPLTKDGKRVDTNALKNELMDLKRQELLEKYNLIEKEDQKPTEVVPASKKQLPSMPAEKNKKAAAPPTEKKPEIKKEPRPPEENPFVAKFDSPEVDVEKLALKLSANAYKKIVKLVDKPGDLTEAEKAEGGALMVELNQIASGYTKVTSPQAANQKIRSKSLVTTAIRALKLWQDKLNSQKKKPDPAPKPEEKKPPAPKVSKKPEKPTKPPVTKAQERPSEVSSDPYAALSEEALKKKAAQGDPIAKLWLEKLQEVKGQALSQTGKGSERALPEQEFQVSDRSSFREAIKQAFGLKEESKKLPFWKSWLSKLGIKFKPGGELDAVMKIADLAADAWAAVHGKTRDDWYRESLRSFRRGGLPKEEALKQLFHEWSGKPEKLDDAIEVTKMKIDGLTQRNKGLAADLKMHGSVKELLKKYTKFERLTEEEQNRLLDFETSYPLTTEKHNEAHRLWKKLFTDPEMDLQVSEMLAKYKRNETVLEGLDKHLTDLYILKKSGLLYQKEGAVKGQVEFLQDGRAIITAFQSADVSTLVHELAHVYRRQLSGKELKIAEQWAGVKDGVWTVKAEEKFARGFERYLADGQAPLPTLKKVFEKFKVWLTEIYKGLVGSEIDIELNDNIRQVFDSLLIGQVKAQYVRSLRRQANIEKIIGGRSDNYTAQDLNDYGRSLAFRALINAKNKLPNNDPLKVEMTDLANQIKNAETYKGPTILRQESKAKETEDAKLKSYQKYVEDQTAKVKDGEQQIQELSDKLKAIKEKKPASAEDVKTQKKFNKELSELKSQQKRDRDDLQRAIESQEYYTMLTEAHQEIPLNRPEGWLFKNPTNLMVQTVIPYLKQNKFDKSLKLLEGTRKYLGKELIGNEATRVITDRVDNFYDKVIGEARAKIRHDLNLANGDFSTMRVALDAALELKNKLPQTVNELVHKALEDKTPWEALKEEKAIADLSVAKRKIVENTLGVLQRYLKTYGNRIALAPDRLPTRIINGLKRLIYNNMARLPMFLKAVQKLMRESKFNIDKINTLASQIEQYDQLDQIKAGQMLTEIYAGTGKPELNKLVNSLKTQLHPVLVELSRIKHSVFKNAAGEILDPSEVSFKELIGEALVHVKDDPRIQDMITQIDKSFSSFKEEGLKLTVSKSIWGKMRQNWEVVSYDEATDFYTLKNDRGEDMNVRGMDYYNWVRPSGKPWKAKSVGGEMEIQRLLDPSELAELEKYRNQTITIMALARETAVAVQKGKVYGMIKALNTSPRKTESMKMKIPDEPRFGDLRGLWTDWDTYRYLNIFDAGSVKMLLDPANKATDFWKSLHTIHSTGTGMTNIISNTVLMMANGVNPYKLKRAGEIYYKAIKDKTSLAEAAGDPNISHTDAVNWQIAHGHKNKLSGQELENWKKMWDKLVHVAQQGRVLETPMQFWRTLTQVSSDFYQGSDVIFRLAHYLDMKEKLEKANPAWKTNPKIAEEIAFTAAEEARKSYVDYQDQNSTLSYVFKNIKVIPFWGFFAGIVPQMMRLLKERPIPAMLLLGGFSFAQAMTDPDNQEQLDPFFKEASQGRILIGNQKLGGLEMLFPRKLLKIPLLKGKQGEPLYADIGKYSTFGTLLTPNKYTAIPLFPKWLEAYGPYSQVLQLYFNSKYGIGSAKIVDKEKDTTLEQAGKYFNWTWSQWAPPYWVLYSRGDKRDVLTRFQEAINNIFGVTIHTPGENIR